MQTAPTPSGHVAFRLSGSGEPLLLIMGVAGHNQVWGEDFVAGLSDQFELAIYDHTGIGQSSRASDHFTIADLAADAAALLDHLGWESAHVLGFSMGGVVAQELALTRPERVRSLILCGTWGTPTVGGESVWGEAIMDLANAASAEDPAASVRLMFEANVSPEFASRPGEFERFLAAAGAEKVPSPVIMNQMRAASAWDAGSRLAGVDIPTLVLHGSADRLIRPEAGAALAALIPGAGQQTLAGVGHHIFWEQGGEAARLVREFLGR